MGEILGRQHLVVPMDIPVQGEIQKRGSMDNNLVRRHRKTNSLSQQMALENSGHNH